MLRADRQIRRLQKQRRQHSTRLNAAKRALEKAIARRDRARSKLERTSTHLESARFTFARAVFVRPNPAGTQRLDKPHLRKQIRALEKKSRQLARQTRALERKVERARKVKQSRWTKVSTSRIEARKAARERAEDKLSTAISQMVALVAAAGRPAPQPRLGQRLSRPCARDHQSALRLHRLRQQPTPRRLPALPRRHRHRGTPWGSGACLGRWLRRLRRPQPVGRRLACLRGHHRARPGVRDDLRSSAAAAAGPRRSACRAGRPDRPCRKHRSQQRAACPLGGQPRLPHHRPPAGGRLTLRPSRSRTCSSPSA